MTPKIAKFTQKLSHFVQYIHSENYQQFFHTWKKFHDPFIFIWTIKCIKKAPAEIGWDGLSYVAVKIASKPSTGQKTMIEISLIFCEN